MQINCYDNHLLNIVISVYNWLLAAGKRSCSVCKQITRLSSTMQSVQCLRGRLYNERRDDDDWTMLHHASFGTM